MVQVQVWPLVDVQSYMGHADISTTMVYAHHIPKHDAADALTRLIGSGMQQPSLHIPS